MRRWLVLLVTLFWSGFGAGLVVAVENVMVATAVNPVRSRELWKDKSLKPIREQYGAIKEANVAATWLLQDDVLDDVDLVEEIRGMNERQELGLFLEVSSKLARKAGVYYPVNRPWYSPEAVFLSGYTLTERKRLIDTMVNSFEEVWRRKPTAVGAWWIDSFSLNYLEDKYGIEVAMIVADQKTTDGYGVWGQWWGYPYHPGRNNPLIPGESQVVMIQWAIRDLEKAYKGSGPLVSNYSLQANDYTSLGLTTKYFEEQASKYLQVQPLGQITIGLEVGTEGVGQEKEWEKQIGWLKRNQIVITTMDQTAEKYRAVYRGNNPIEVKIGNWKLSPWFRSNDALGEKIVYNSKIAFADKFVADKNVFLDRVLPRQEMRSTRSYWPWWVIGLPGWWWWGKKRGMKSKEIVAAGGWWLMLFWFVFRSRGEAGWVVNYGPRLESVEWWQIGLMVAGGWWLPRLKKMSWWGWSWWPLVTATRVSVVEGKYYIGWLVDSFRFVGIGLGRGVELINSDLSNLVAQSMYRFKMEWIWGNWWIWLIAYPGLMMVVSTITGRILKKAPRGIRLIATVLVAIYCYQILTADPSGVVAIR